MIQTKTVPALPKLPKQPQWLNEHFAAWAPELIERVSDPELDKPLTRRDVLELFRLWGAGSVSDEERGRIKHYASRFWSFVTGRDSREFPKGEAFFTWGATYKL